ncbi:hypothetical protein K1719_016526 [Acacia pycnantha]|nr:hypothetical protein K1719_016526 [Acacia pycnantha]
MVDVPFFTHSIPYGECYFNGAYHWLAGDHNNCRFIVSFDFSKEVFGIIQSPPLVTCSPPMDFLAVVDDCLAWVRTYNFSESRVEIWVMNEYGVESSWTKTFEIGPYRGLTDLFFGFWGDNEILVAEHIIGPLISYNLRNQQRGRLQIYLRELITKDYVESLFPLGGKRKPGKL